MALTTHTTNKLYLLHLSVHGLVRGQNLELGRDADTGGQIKYVVELATALGRRDEVERVDLLTRLIADPSVSTDYSEPIETVSDKVRIVRIEAGPKEVYFPKERLWDHLDGFIDNALVLLRSQPRLPDLLHAHYADAGYVGTRLSQLLGIPLIFTGHSLGRVKRRRLIATGLTKEAVDNRYNTATIWRNINFTCRRRELSNEVLSFHTEHADGAIQALGQSDYLLILRKRDVAC